MKCTAYEVGSGFFYRRCDKPAKVMAKLYHGDKSRTPLCGIHARRTFNVRAITPADEETYKQWTAGLEKLRFKIQEANLKIKEAQKGLADARENYNKYPSFSVTEEP